MSLRKRAPPRRKIPARPPHLGPAQSLPPAGEDIPESRRARAALAESEPHPRLIIDNALDAVIAVFNAVNAMRQQVHPDIRITGIITEGPTAIASIPERAAAKVRNVCRPICIAT